MYQLQWCYYRAATDCNLSNKHQRAAVFPYQCFHHPHECRNYTWAHEGKKTTKQTSVVKKRGNNQHLKHNSPVITSLLLTFSPVNAVLWPRLHPSIVKTLDNATSMFAILSEMMASVTSASGLNSQNIFLKILILYLQITEVKKKIYLGNTDLKPHNAQSLYLLPFSINILSVPLSLEEVVPGGNRTIYHQKAECLLILIDNYFPSAAGTLPSEASERLLGKASATVLFTRRCWSSWPATSTESTANLPKRWNKKLASITLQTSLL